MRTLNEIINNRQLYESYGIQLMDNKIVETEDDFIDALFVINSHLQKLDVNVISNDTITEKDLTDVKFYMNDMLCELRRNQNKRDE